MFHLRAAQHQLSRSTWCATVILLALAAAPALADYGEVHVRDTAGLAREQWPVQVGVSVPADASVDALQLAKVRDDDSLRRVHFQVIDVVEPSYDDGREPSDSTRLVEIAFLVTLPADGTQVYRLYHGEPARELDAPRELPKLAIERGEPLQRTVDTGAARFAFHPDSGQLTSYRVAGSDATPTFTQFNGSWAVHSSGDLWSPPYRWSNGRYWNVTEHIVEHHEAAGPIVWRLVRHGTLPNSNGVTLSTSYTVFAGQPYILDVSKMRFTRPTAVRAVRNNQLVFTRGLHTHGVYLTHAGELHTARGFDPENPETHHRRLGLDPLRPDIPFIGLFHDSNGHGIGMINLERFAHAPGTLASAQQAGAHYYFYDGRIHGNPDDNFFYFSRAEVFNYEFDGHWYRTTIPEGAVYATRSAILAFPVEDAASADTDAGRFSGIERWTKLLRNPPHVTVR